MTRATPEVSAPKPRAPRALLALCAVAALSGYVAGVVGFVPVELVTRSTSTPLTRVGYALRAKQVEASNDAWALLRGDVAELRRGSSARDPRVFDLVVALRGLESGGHPEWTKAEGLCRELGWSRCDRNALEELEQRSRP